jgi:hypothetical protein
MKIPENTKNDPDDPEAADGYIQMEYSTDQFISPSTRAVTKNYIKSTQISIGTT